VVTHKSWADAQAFAREAADTVNGLSSSNVVVEYMDENHAFRRESADGRAARLAASAEKDRLLMVDVTVCWPCYGDEHEKCIGAGIPRQWRTPDGGQKSYCYCDGRGHQMTWGSGSAANK
jgi:hypothetical protein